MKYIFIALLFSLVLPAGGSSYSPIEFSINHLIPFVGMLLSIAIIPLFFHQFWDKHFGKVSVFWALAFLIPFYFKVNSLNVVFEAVVHTMLLEYFPFIIILLSLFVVAGGICLEGKLVGTPKLNTILLTIGTILASWMGTTGAAMLMIRPVIKANKWRLKKVHIIVFFIFLVANIGGSLTPLGDPPLFLGFLKGVDFFWATTNLFFPFLYVSIILITVFYIIDSYFYSKEINIPEDTNNDFSDVKILGKINFIFLLFVILSVLLSGVWKPHTESFKPFLVFGTPVELQNIIRDVLLILIAYLSLKFTPVDIRKKNSFTWFPILEVSKLFVGIFITIIPAIAILKQGLNGPLHWIVSMLSTSSGEPNNFMYFWLTGILSGFLDNAPTYLIFFNTAGAAVESETASFLMTTLRPTLVAISCGAVFMGALTYIGNAPNFMVRAIAEENNIKMPSFFGFMAWSFIILGLTFLSYSLILM